MYGVLVGKVSVLIVKGGLFFIENVKYESVKVIVKIEFIGWIVFNVDKWKDRIFMGYYRIDG